MPLSRTAVWLAGVSPRRLRSHKPPLLRPSIAALDFPALQSAAQALAGAEHSEDGGFEVVTLAQPDTWRVAYGFTTRWHPAYPAVTLRTFRKQVTGVWTAQSKVCGYGDQAQFAALMAEMKSGDKKLTDASRDEVERRQAESVALRPRLTNANRNLECCAPPSSSSPAPTATAT